MAITFHCEHCGRKIEAQESAGGKWGKCPACHNKVYVPNPEADEEIKLAPIDEQEEKQKKQLMAETYKVTQDILSEREAPDSLLGATGSAPEMTDDELTKAILTYLQQMVTGQLDHARRNEGVIVTFGERALKIVDKIAVAEMGQPELAKVPPQVLAGLIRNLRSRLSPA